MKDAFLLDMPPLAPRATLAKSITLPVDTPQEDDEQDREKVFVAQFFHR